MKVSIIMPVYNSAEYVRKAAESVVHQNFDDFELIMVDDGSTDGSGKVCDELAAKHDKIKVIHKTNGGICSARNAALEVATGEYIGFCDNDDEYLPDLIKDNYEKASINNVDLMRYAKKKTLLLENGKSRVTTTDIPDELYIERENFAKYYSLIRVENTVWTAFYKNSIIQENNIRFNTDYKFGAEDANFNLQFLYHANKLGFNPSVYYSWTQRMTHSTSKKFRREYLECEALNFDLEYRFLSEVCGEGVDNFLKNKFYINAYIYNLVDYLNLESSDMKLKEKSEYLNNLRSSRIFDEHLPKETLKKARKNSFRLYLVMKLFYRRKMKSLVVILKTGTGILNAFRYK